MEPNRDFMREEPSSHTRVLTTMSLHTMSVIFIVRSPDGGHRGIEKKSTMTLEYSPEFG